MERIIQRSRKYKLDKRSIILEIIIGLFIILFFYTGVMKLIDQPTFEFDLINAPVISFITPIALKSVPIIELLTVACLLIPKTRKIGLYSSVSLMIIFTIYVGGILSFAKHKPCTCGGVLREMTWGQHFVFNIIFSLLAMTALYIYKVNKRNVDDSNS